MSPSKLAQTCETLSLHFHRTVAVEQANKQLKFQHFEEIFADRLFQKYRSKDITFKQVFVNLKLKCLKNNLI